MDGKGGLGAEQQEKLRQFRVTSDFHNTTRTLKQKTAASQKELAAKSTCDLFLLFSDQDENRQPEIFESTP